MPRRLRGAIAAPGWDRVPVQKEPGSQVRCPVATLWFSVHSVFPALMQTWSATQIRELMARVAESRTRLGGELPRRNREEYHTGARSVSPARKGE